MRVEVVLAWPEHFQVRLLELPEGTSVSEAIRTADLDPQGHSRACAVHGVLAHPQQMLRDGDRVELLRPLQIDPKEARRRRAQAS